MLLVLLRGANFSIQQYVYRRNERDFVGIFNSYKIHFYKTVQTLKKFFFVNIAYYVYIDLYIPIYIPNQAIRVAKLCF